MTGRSLAGFDPAAFLSKAGIGRRIVQLQTKEPFFSQGDKGDCVFYLQKGRAKLTVISKVGKEATIALLGAGDFLGEDSVAAVAGLRLATATATTACTALKIDPRQMIRGIPEEHAFHDVFLAFA